MDAQLQPLDDYYLWCDHRAWEEAALITETARARGLDAIQWCGGIYSSEWGWAKLLHWLRHNPDKRDRMATALEHCDMAAAVLCGIADPARAPRSICAMGHKWMWNRQLGGLPPEEFLTAVDPLLGRRPREARRRVCHQHPHRRTALSGMGAEARTARGHPGSDRRFRCALGRHRRRAAASATSSTWSAPPPASWRSPDEPALIPGVCGVVPGSIHPGKTGVEAGLSATGDIFDAIARRAGTTVAQLVRGPRELPRGPDRPAAHDVGQRRSHRAGEPRAERRHAGLAAHAHGAGRAVRGDRRARRSTRA